MIAILRRPLRLAVLVVTALAPGASAQAATPITTCGYSITAPGSYVLANDISCGSNHEGIYIAASDVNLSLGGNTISAGDNGIRVGNHGMFGDPPERVHITGPGTIVGDGSGTGVKFDYILSSGVSGVTVIGAAVGVESIGNEPMHDAARTYIRNNKLDGMVNGVKVTWGGAIVENNSCSSRPRGAGIFVGPESIRSEISGNTCNDSGYGIFVIAGSKDNHIHDNTALRNSEYDAFDGNASCATNVWSHNTFGTFSPACANVDPAPTCIEGTAGADTLIGTSGNDRICGLGGNDTIRGMGGDDELVGGDGNDTLNGGAGADTLAGGAGSDKVSYANDAAGVLVDLAAGTATDGGGAADVLSGVENVDGSAFADDLRGDGAANVLHGYGAADSLTGAGWADTLHGDAGDDLVSGGDANDLVYPGTGDDTVHGGAGTDRVSYASGIIGGIIASLDTGAVSALGSGANAGEDGLSSTETLVGTPADDDLTAQTTGIRRKLEGVGGDDVLRTADGDSLDTVSGGAGADVCVRDAGDATSSC